MKVSVVRAGVFAAAGALIIGGGLVGCSSSSSSSTASSSAASQSAAITIVDPVVRATDELSPVGKDSGKLMTGSFMTIKNSSGSEVTLTGGTSPVAGKIEIHEVKDGQMVPLAGGLKIPANGEVTLRMGGYHVMLMDLTGPLAAGSEVEMTLDFSDGEKLPVKAPVKTIGMDDEKYGPDMGGASPSGSSSTSME